MRSYLKEVRQKLFVEEKKRGKDEGKKFNALYQKDYVDLVGGIIKSYLLLKQALVSEKKVIVAESYINRVLVAAEHCKSKVNSNIDDIINGAYNKLFGVE